jgi:hypothetical protein
MTNTYGKQVSTKKKNIEKPDTNTEHKWPTVMSDTNDSLKGPTLNVNKNGRHLGESKMVNQNVDKK